MKSAVVKRSIKLAGHRTSVSLEDPFWRGLKQIAKDQRKTLSELVGSIDTNRKDGNLSSALRLFVLSHYQAQAASHPSVHNSALSSETLLLRASNDLQVDGA